MFAVDMQTVCMSCESLSFSSTQHFAALINVYTNVPLFHQIHSFLLAIHFMANVFVWLEKTWNEIQSRQKKRERSTQMLGVDFHLSSFVIDIFLFFSFLLLLLLPFSMIFEFDIRHTIRADTQTLLLIANSANFAIVFLLIYSSFDGDNWRNILPVFQFPFLFIWYLSTSLSHQLFHLTFTIEFYRFVDVGKRMVGCIEMHFPTKSCLHVCASGWCLCVSIRNFAISNRFVCWMTCFKYDRNHSGNSNDVSDLCFYLPSPNVDTKISIHPHTPQVYATKDFNGSR